MTPEQFAFSLLAAGAGGGVMLALLVICGRRVPPWLGSAHGLTGLLGLVVLFLANLHAGVRASASAWWSLGLMAAALIGGLILFRTLFRARIPLPLVGLHAALAAGGLWLLNPLAFDF